jgi:drug/metabolite transporter (DMT)-like permease
MTAAAPHDGGRRGWRTWQLFALAVAIWGTTWHAITWQLALATPEFGVAMRFALAGVLVLAGCAATGQPWRMNAGQHAWLALQGVFMYSVSYLCAYHAERHVPSGLVAVGYSASPLVNGLAAHWLWGQPLTRRFLLGGVLGLVGVALIFGPEIAAMLGGPATAPAGGGHAPLTGNASLGALFTLGAVLLSSVGSLASSRNRQRGLPLWPALGWGMQWGAAASWAVVLASGQPLTLPTAPGWWLSLLYLALAGSVVAFACYLLLQQRVGPGAASTVGVATPVLALVVSALLEGYRPGLPVALGVLLAVTGNVMILKPAS